MSLQIAYLGILNYVLDKTSNFKSLGFGNLQLGTIFWHV